LCILFFFFFSSRRRHTRFSRDWSSDVCSSDLTRRLWAGRPGTDTCLACARFRRMVDQVFWLVIGLAFFVLVETSVVLFVIAMVRSEERRVGKECRCGWGAVLVEVERSGVCWMR